MAVVLSPTEMPLPAAQLADNAPGATSRRLRARAALKLADQLLDRLEQLELHDQHQVPDSLLALIGTVARAAATAGIEQAPLITHAGVVRLMDEIYDLEGKLLPRCRRRVYPPMPGQH